MSLVEEAHGRGCRLRPALSCVGLSLRTYQRWKRLRGGEDLRRGPRDGPSNRLTETEREEVLAIANSPEFRNLSPQQIVPLLAARGEYVASESTFYRLLHSMDQMKHRARSAPARRGRPRELVASGPNQVWSWDITYLRTSTRGVFYYLYVIVDVWSRKIVGWSLHDVESTEHAAAMVLKAYLVENVSPHTLVLHSDNGAPMKGVGLLTMLQHLGVAPSFSRPAVSNDNPYSESLFRTLKYRPNYPTTAFKTLEAAQAWVAAFVTWYNTDHLHSRINFVTPHQRHTGEETGILEARGRVYEIARRRNPSRWSGKTRNCQPAGSVRLNPPKATKIVLAEAV